ncbi:MAG: hypothetical protein A3C35_03335 [Omnitrophica bacterium RIFCSPHIGHO2_02_FULL_46_11]|nr:MAG: hypothetical protein A3C35_03335 [Omnitrophica bacterium RIFCSPHIGHO2_02_FULL_46_11]
MGNSMLVFIFWFLIAVIFYTYAGYPVCLLIVSSFKKRDVKKGVYEPRVSVVVSAFNEEKAIEQKLLNLLELNYPTEKLEILIGSDGASDRTDEIVSRFHSPRIRFFRFVKNFGKPHVLNALLEEACGEIIVFTDVRQELDYESIHALAANFKDPEVGCVSGELCFKTEARSILGHVGKGMDLYWRYEKFLRKKESEIGSMLGATGAIYAIRRSLFCPVPLDILVDDMYVPLSIVERGYRAVFESRALAYDRPSERGGEEFKRKVRTLAGNYQIFLHFLNFFMPWKSPIAWQLFSHKFLRVIAPFSLFGLLASNLFILSHPFYFWFFLAQILFYGMAIFEAYYARGTTHRKGIGYLPYTFCLLNYSALVGLVRFLTGRQKTAWEKAYA